MQDIVINDKIVGYGKAVKQVAYSEIINSGHHLLHDEAATLNVLFKSWVSSMTEEETEKNISIE